MGLQNYDNPFHYNYMFQDYDIARFKIHWTDRLWLWLLPTYVQITNGYVIHFKNINGKYYLMKYEKLSNRAN